MGSDRPDHRTTLLGEEGVELGLDYVEYYAAKPDGYEAEDKLCFFNLVLRALPPRIFGFAR